MTQHYDADVAIVGYGPTGVIAALALAKHGISTIAFERHRDIYPRARAVTVNDWTMRIFQNLGVDEPVLKQIDPQRALRWMRYDGTEILRIEHPPSTLGIKPRFFNIYQPTMEATLRECAAAHSERIDVRYGSDVVALEQDEDGVTVTAKDAATGELNSVRVRYVIGCDGGSSATRGMIGVKLLGDTLDVQWIVIDCRVKRWWPDRNLLTFWSDKERPVVDIALSGGNHRWELPLKPGETEADFSTSEQVWPLLEALGVSEDDVEIHQHAFYRHHTRMADRWRVGRVFLAGDAAHLMPPWAGAGMQTGMRDAFDLGWKLAGVLNGRLPVHFLDTYETERRPNASFYTELAVQLGRIIKQELTDEEQAALNAPPSPNAPEAPLIAPPVLAAGWLRGPLGEGSIVGRMVPQPVVGDNRGVMARLDDLLGDGFALLGDDVDPASLLTPQEKAEWDRLGARYIALRQQDQRTQGHDELIDLDGVLRPWLRKYGVRAVALRPDRFVAAADVSGLAVPA
ncbi:bifunctional 3-(3-hydroxy-phenyl)propionate/3-hydroxycinnamic acid hydroxylase [Burkholderia multivorans]|uniref:3-(3-hydroxy-phenyl)propionate hydroxylase n=1 Tax=Burkholderia multivorans CGD2 TaxID=513052 RepID=B9BLL1_9BURK|nr:MULTISPECIES: bifunctional 3-(3-hydroxy-phenyl)propionate/3-hydroxycinnamic acid hydroxylase [Burkholderia]AJY15482.1 pyridine nucleotide-disulfide oxidoreductase family protein [Burkholderia multivorans ATCC BAA-247]AVR18167.1 bifunctional 3-(3-hydroxy-phenyl)propionate/3-hydroxycinnamic acid hydroxylase [Burkholderia multivorans]EEE08828.1 3-(3-hydroxy-phenyl)propionate hydroxylase [Burkholderia multivorans CGD2]EEE16514.1 3-(3-hydroxy-phenyl)propionate hydroxylase [Burkholderia multivoran